MENLKAVDNQHAVLLATLEHILQNQKQNKEEMRSLLLSGFPGGDIEGHARYHEAVIEDIATRKKLTQAIQEKTVAGLVWAALVGLGVAVYHELFRRG